MRHARLSLLIDVIEDVGQHQRNSTNQGRTRGNECDGHKGKDKKSKITPEWRPFAVANGDGNRKETGEGQGVRTRGHTDG